MDKEEMVVMDLTINMIGKAVVLVVQVVLLVGVMVEMQVVMGM